MDTKGNKKENVTIIYTPWSNLKKDGSMAIGQVGFHNQKLVRDPLFFPRRRSLFNLLLAVSRPLFLARPHQPQAHQYHL